MSLFNLLYLDPAAVSVLLSSITVIVLGIGASLIIWWRKFKKKVNKTLNIDPNKGKEVEEDLVITEDTTTDNQVTVEDCDKKTVDKKEL
ncbi:MAG: hypothetical protein IJX16_01540 [Clostridia bacterium]|nr:hypothetical protein [Clostridia bacterium]